MGRRLLAAPVVVLAAVLAVLLPPSVAVAAVSPTSTVGTLAGTGAARFAWDGGQAIQAGLRNPRGVSFDSAGRLLVADTLNNRIRVVAADG